MKNPFYALLPASYYCKILPVIMLTLFMLSA